jgi:hypothetical protein
MRTDPRGFLIVGVTTDTSRRSLILTADSSSVVNAACGQEAHLPFRLRAWGARYVRLILDHCLGDKREACRVLDISDHTLVAYLRFAPDSDGADAPASAADAPADEILGDIIEETV